MDAIKEAMIADDDGRSEIGSIAQRKRRMEDIRRDCFKRKLKFIADDCEEATDHCRDLIRSGADVSEELKELECTANGLLLVALLLKREHESAE